MIDLVVSVLSERWTTLALVAFVENNQILQAVYPSDNFFLNLLISIAI